MNSHLNDYWKERTDWESALGLAIGGLQGVSWQVEPGLRGRIETLLADIEKRRTAIRVREPLNPPVNLLEELAEQLALIEWNGHHTLRSCTEGGRKRMLEMSQKVIDLLPAARYRAALEAIEKMPWPDSNSPYAIIARKGLGGTPNEFDRAAAITAYYDEHGHVPEGMF